MRRPRRHRWITVSVFFIAYSVLQAAFTLSNASEPASDVDLPEKIEKTEKGIQSTPADPKDEIVKVTRKYESDAITTEPRLNPEVSYEKTTGIEENIDDYTMMKDDNYVEEKKELENEINYFSGMKSDYQRVGCTPPAIEQFPKPLMGESLRKQGGLIIHVLVAVFTFIGLVIVCNEYFVSSLHRICKELQLAPDVAGATFMAAGSSAPELATVVIGIFCAKDDIGVSGTIGSAMSNIMFVISVCALCAGTVSHLNWWPLCRDCFFYALSILVMLCTIADGFVSWSEALFMLIMYGVYCVVLRFNTALERWAITLFLPFYLSRKDRAAFITYNAGEAPPATASEITQMERETSETLILQNASNLQLLYWYMAYPIRWSCRHTIPDCRGRWYPITFIVSILWISFYSYFMVWMITIIGDTLGIPSTAMMLSIVAVGVSVPDALSSVAVIKEGYGDMAVSNAVGSNVFDILVCLGLPWFIQTAIIYPGYHVNVISKGIIYSSFLLFAPMIFLLVATHANSWKLDRKFGAVLMAWYVLLITLASLYELNIFGLTNPPDCNSAY